MKKIALVVLAVFVLSPLGMAQVSEQAFEKALLPCQYYDAHSAYLNVEGNELIEFDMETAENLLSTGKLPTDEQFSCIAHFMSFHDENARKLLEKFVNAGKNVDTEDAQGRTAFELLLKHTGYSSEQLAWTIDTAWKLHQLGSKDINAVGNGHDTILHLIVRGVPFQWPTKLDQWVKAGVKDLPNSLGKTAFQELEETIKRVCDDNRLYRGLFEDCVSREYRLAEKILKNTPEEKERRAQRRAQRRQGKLELLGQTLENISKADK